MSASPHTGEPEEISAAAARWVARRDAGLDTAGQAELERWLRADPRHPAAFSRFAQAWSSLDRPGAPILRELGQRARGRRRRRLRAAVAVLVVGITTGLWWQWKMPARHAFVPVASATAYIVPETRVLPDGSRVDLRESAEIEVRFAPSGPRRVALLRGEAHFAVAKDASRPFVVESGGVRVRAVGTAFSVQHGANEIEVLVTEGRVAIESAAGLLATVGAGNRAAVPLAHGASAVVEPLAAEHAEARLAWRVPRIEFSDTPLARAVDLMNAAPRAPDEVTRPRLVLDPAALELSREPVSGLFRAGNADAFVRVLELSLGVRAERRGDEIVLRKGP